MATEEYEEKLAIFGQLKTYFCRSEVNSDLVR